MNIFKDSKGNWSSKRIFGGLLVAIGAGFKIALMAASFKGVVPGAETIQTSSTWLIGFGSGLIGVSVVEFLGK